jgi:hypothetical protein
MTKSTAGTSPGNPLPDIAAHRHAELIESLSRISIGIEVLNATAEQISRQLADSIVRTEAALKFVARTWQEAHADKGSGA